ncbi:MAG: hypothetical protein M3355_12100 [Actinomycetota bacterium]|nr:hypothetical protein [Actinomycetota bacterium]
MPKVTYAGPSDALEVGDKTYPRDVPVEATKAEVKRLEDLGLELKVENDRPSGSDNDKKETK